MRIIKITGLLVLSLFLFSCEESPEERYKPEYAQTPVLDTEKVYVFGIHPLHNPRRLHEVFGPLARYLTEQLPGVKFRIEASRNYASFDEKLYSRKFDFSLPNPYQTINALKHGYHVFGKMADDKNFRGIFLVRKDSEISSVMDLKGRVVSFPAPTALAATMLPQYFLKSQGLDVMNDIEIRYVGSQESSIMNVMLGNAMAGATWPPPWRALVKERPELAKELKVIWQTDFLPNNALVVRDDVDPEIQMRVKKLLLDLHIYKRGKELLNRMGLSKFEDATDQTYEPVVDFLHKFSKEVRPLE